MLLHNTYICCATYGLPDTNFLQERSGEAQSCRGALKMSPTGMDTLRKLTQQRCRRCYISVVMRSLGSRYSRELLRDAGRITKVKFFTK